MEWNSFRKDENRKECYRIEWIGIEQIIIERNGIGWN